MEIIDEETGGSGTSSRLPNQKFVDLRRKNTFLLRYKYILLTYSQVNEDEFHWSGIQQIVNQMGGRCRIGRERHQNGGIHYHAFCAREKRFVTRDSRRFDVNGHHPNIQPVMRTPEKSWAYALKDGDVMVDELPEPPKGRHGRTKMSADVWGTLVPNSTSTDNMLNNAYKADPRRTLCSFNSINSAAKYFFPTTSYCEYTPPPGLEYEFGEYPQLAAWKQRYFCEYTPTSLDTDALPAGPASGGDSVYSGQDSALGGTSTPSIQSIDSFPDSGVELSRYTDTAATNNHTKLILRPNQHRPKCLCIIGPSRLGKTLVARSFGPHSYFHGQWNVEQYNPDGLYNVFDDIKGQLDGFDFKSFMGAQSDVSVTDKYHKKRTIRNGKPAIYLSNKDPLTTRRGREDHPWLHANCIFVYINSPICNIARESLELQAFEDTFMYIA